VIYFHSWDLDRTVENKEGVELTGSGRRRGPGIVDPNGKGVPVIAELRGDEDDAQLEVAKVLAKGRSRIRPAVMGRGGRRLEPWSCCAEHEGV
jgi:hypothetical protein